MTNTNAKTYARLSDIPVSAIYKENVNIFLESDAYPGDVFESAVNGKRYILTNATNRGADKCSYTLKELEDVEGRYVLSENNLVVNSLTAFFCTYRRGFFELEEDIVYLQDGVLFVGDKIVDTGTLKVKHVIHGGSLKHALLIVEGKDSKDVDELFSYDIQNDEFFRHCSGFFVDANVMTDWGRYILVKVYNRSNLTEEEIEAGIKKNDITYCLFDKDGRLIGTPLVVHQVSEERVELFNNQFIFYFQNEQGGDWTVFLNNFVLDADVWELRLTDEEVKSGVLFNKTHSQVNGLLVKTNERIIFTNDGYHPRQARGPVAMKAIKEYPYFVKLIPGARKNTFILANERHETIELKVTKTDDRGFVTEIVK